ncbi:MAG: hypothetical protein KKA90_00420 [Nanoarchaeota archaeon]|nr:hypothetical protein [Nanoarchaeota archaeon]
MLYPLLSNTPRTTRDAVIMILGDQCPLTAKKIYNEIRRLGLAVTYQAVHKTVKWLVVQRVLVRSDTGYLLDRDWMLRLRSFGKRVDHVYGVDGSNAPLLKATGQTFTKQFGSIAEFLGYFFGTIGAYVKQRDVSLQAGLVRHLWWPFIQHSQSYVQFRELLRVPTVFAVARQTPGDQALAQLYAECRATVRTVGFPGGADIFVTDGLVVEVYYPHDVVQELDAAFLNLGSATTGVAQLYDVLFKACAVDVVLVRNEALAKQKLDHLRQVLAADVPVAKNTKLTEYS